MFDFDHLNEQLDLAGYDLEKVRNLYEEACAEIEAAPADQRVQLEARLLQLCHQRADREKRLFEIHLEALEAFREVKKIDEGHPGSTL